MWCVISLSRKSPFLPPVTPEPSSTDVKSTECQPVPHQWRCRTVGQACTHRTRLEKEIRRTESDRRIVTHAQAVSDMQRETHLSVCGCCLNVTVSWSAVRCPLGNGQVTILLNSYFIWWTSLRRTAWRPFRWMPVATTLISIMPSDSRYECS